jgi:benzoyl-CoA reductase/2-hydroxyglutaryl-CoA dehydratase subunit BcrC/BadD/HgdB
VTVFEEIQKHYQQRDLAAREWKKNGEKVVGYFCDNVPEELILAAGFFPLRISGDPWSSTEIAKQHVLPRAPNREEFVHSMLNMILTGKYDFLDFLVIPHARDSISGLYQVLIAAMESNHTLKLPELYFFDNLHTTFYLSQLYDRERVLELKKKLEEWSGKEISNDSLSRAIVITNENKLLLKKVAALRAAEPPRLSGVEALQIIGTSMFMLKEEHNKLLWQFLQVAGELPARDGGRLFVGGTPLDNLQFYQIVESCKATVVGEDNCWGNRYSDVPVDTSISNPLEALVDRYHHKSPCPRTYPLIRRVEYCVKSTVDAKAQGVIFNSMENDSQAWDIPDEIKALEEKGIPSLYLKKQPYLITDPESTRASIKEFIRDIKKRDK